MRASAAAAASAHAGRPLPEDDRLLYETREQSQLHCANAVNEEAEQDPKASIDFFTYSLTFQKII